jgi:hypothetical protein
MIKKIRTKFKKITHHKLGLKGEIENKLNFYKRKRKLEIKRIRTEV